MSFRSVSPMPAIGQWPHPEARNGGRSWLIKVPISATPATTNSVAPGAWAASQGHGTCGAWKRCSVPGRPDWACDMSKVPQGAGESGQPLVQVSSRTTSAPVDLVAESGIGLAPAPKSVFNGPRPGRPRPSASSVLALAKRLPAR